MIVFQAIKESHAFGGEVSAFSRGKQSHKKKRRNQRGASVADGNCDSSAVLQAGVIDPAMGTDHRYQRVIKPVKNSLPGGKVC